MDPTKILIVEDEGIIAVDLRERLEELGYSVSAIVASGEEAIRNAAELRPDLVLMDVVLQGEMDGIEAAEQIRGQLGLPVVFLTAHADNETVQRAKVTEPFGYILKPFEERELHTSIQMALYRSRLEQKLRESEERHRWEARVNAAVAELARLLISPATIEMISLLVLDQAKRLTSSAFGYVGYIDQETGYLVCPTLTRDIWDTCQVEHKDIVFRKFGGLWGWVLQNRTPLRTNTPADDPRSTGTPPGHIPIHRFLSAPALTGDELVGQVAVANADRDYTEQDLALTEQLASLYALAVTRKRAEEVLRQYAIEMEERNQELDAFAHTAAHDLKNPVTVITGYAEFLEKYEGDLSDSEAKQYLHMIAQSGRKLSNVIRELLLLASVRRMDVELSPIDMARVVEEARRRMADMIEEYQAKLIVPDTWPTASGHGPWIEEVWINYISNAIKYGGRPPRVELGAEVQPDGMVRFWVLDNGAGIPAEAQSRLFTPFARLAQIRAEGHGLGLSIVLRIIEKLGGRVGVQSSGVPGRGCVFSFTLPGAAI